MAVICVLSSLNDALSLKGDAQAADVLLATNLETSIALMSAGLPFLDIGSFSADIPRLSLFDKAKQQTLKGFKHDAFSLLAGGPYPILSMQQSRLLLATIEMVQSLEVAGRILEANPSDTFRTFARPHPASGPIFKLVAQGGGMESEALALLDARRVQISGQAPDFPAADPDPVPWRNGSGGSPLAFRPSASSRKRVVILAAGWHYFQYIREMLLLLSEECECHLFVGYHPITEEDQRLMALRGIHVYQDCVDSLPEFVALQKEWASVSKAVADRPDWVAALDEDFHHRGAPYGSEWVSRVIRSQLLPAIPSTMVRLAWWDVVLQHLQPDVLATQFCVHPAENAPVFAARRLGIPTLGLEHSVGGWFSTLRHSFGTRWYAANGPSDIQMLTRVTGSSPGTVVPIGEIRGLTKSLGIDSAPIRRKLGFDPNKPICLICDNSGWSQTTTTRHAGLAILGAVIRLSQSFPHVNFVFRVHHGCEYVELRFLFQSLSSMYPNLSLQVSPNPPVQEIFAIADICVSQHTSAVAEALLHGVKVLFWRQWTLPEPSYVACDSLRIVRTEEELHNELNLFVATRPSRQNIVEGAAKYLDQAFLGGAFDYENARMRLANLVIDLASIPRGTQGCSGWEDWEARIKACAAFDSAKNFEGKDAPCQ